MKIAVVGSGAMGSLFGGLLAEGGNDVTLIDVWREHIEKIKKEGLKISGVSGERAIKVNATTNPAEVGKVDLILIFVKSYDTEKAAGDSKPLIGDETVILTLQNGLGNIEKIAKVAGIEKVIAGTTTHGATLLAPGSIFHAGAGETTIGELDGSITDRITKIADTFTKSGIKTTVSNKIMNIIWGKLLINIGINPFTALTEMLNGQLLIFPEIRQLMAEAIKEALKVAEAQGIKLDYDPIEKTIKVAEATAKNKSSMLQDILRGKRTEIDAITGEVVRLGEKYGIPTLVNKTLYALVKAKEWRRMHKEEE